MYTDLTDDGFDKIPGAEGVNRLLDEGEVPQAMWWYPVVYFGLGIFALMIYGLTSNVMQRGVIQSGGQDGSLMLMCIFIEVGFVVFGIMGITVFWPAILFPVPALALLTSTKHYSVG
jgi:4-amino-4-deoxy-L-arabinose transferase-like glycosyltransferase